MADARLTRPFPRPDAVRAESCGGPAFWPCLADIGVSPDGGRVRVWLWGELDLGGRRLEPELNETLRRAESGIDLDLSGVEFCDCSGLGILIALRGRALAQGKTVTVSGASPQVERLLDLTGTRELFADLRPDGISPPRDGSTCAPAKLPRPVGAPSGTAPGSAAPGKPRKRRAGVAAKPASAPAAAAVDGEPGMWTTAARPWCGRP